MIALRFDLVAHNLQKEVFGLTSKTSENWRNDYLALGFFPDTEGPGENRLLFVRPPEVETMAE